MSLSPLLSFGCLVTINVLRFFLTVPGVGLQRVIVICPDHSFYLLGVQNSCVIYFRKSLLLALQLIKYQNTIFREAMLICIYLNFVLGLNIIT